MIVELLKGHTSPETAYTVQDYPYGFRLRCQIRYWVEYKKGKGCRTVSQTSNPKKPGLVWNKPKAGTYSPYGEALYLNEEGHVKVAGLNAYSTAQEAADWREKYGEGVPAEARPVLDLWVDAKRKYEELRDAGKLEITTTVTAPDGTVTTKTENLKDWPK